MIKAIWRVFFAGLVILVPTSATILLLTTLFTTLDKLIAGYMADPFLGVGILLLVIIIVLAGIIADHVIGEKLLNHIEHRLEQIPLVESIYMTLKSMTDLINYRSRFRTNTVVAFAFPRDGLWAIGFLMGTAPAPIQASTLPDIQMVFVPTAIHPFTGYLALIPQHAIVPLNLPPEDAMKLEFSAGFYKPQKGWLNPPAPTR